MEIPLNYESEQFIRRQIQAGCYHSAGELIQDALRLLKERIRPTEGMPTVANPDRAGDPNQPPSERARHSPRGILADLRSDISAEDITELRREMWANFPRDDL